MYTKVSASVSASLNRRDIIQLLEDGKLEEDGLTITIAEPEAKKLLDKIQDNVETKQLSTNPTNTQI